MKSKIANKTGKMVMALLKEYKEVVKTVEKEQDTEIQAHDKAIAAISSDNIAVIIKAVNKIYLDLYDLDAWHINCGQCEEFATDVIDLLGGETDKIVLLWDSQINCEGSHCVISYQEKYYDSQHPYGSTLKECQRWKIWD